MSDFTYRAIGLRGTMEEGALSAPDLIGAREILKSRGYTPVKITEGLPKKGILGHREYKLSLQELVYFCRQFATILNAGVSLVNGLNLLRRQNLSKNLKAEVDRLFAEVQTGRSLSEVMEEARGRYPTILINMIASGELSGNLDTVMLSMSTYYEKEAHVKQKLQNLMIYPSVLGFAALGLVAFFINFLLPELIGMLQESGVALPALTRFIIFSSSFLKQNFLTLFAVIVILVVVIKKIIAHPRAKAFLDRASLRAPVLGGLVKTLIHARFSMTLAILLKSGVPLMQSLNSVKRVIDNTVAGEGIQRAIDGLNRGETMAGNLATINFFDDLFLKFMEIGEETGELEGILDLMAKNYDEQSETAFARLTSMVEPAMTILMGVIVAGIVLSVMLPMFSMLDSVKH
ncbi:MAG: type II secretion system F family protein [Desulfocucumaceae bacterium]